ncbi:flagellar basal body P-ring protein FlgI [Acuticoccus sp. MNP-M23]|uniref:flagellar basal body P-ring protein FlgI n=1 Tax=Acuticoccus sp. MNP-M23 TaxID=3072793 RepID=UPI0028159771|nr:flagellar basal body P-ring protein FlgI [Acuticoccus sp. MNP-M23]WMS41793.1 flagellar basal body P-ring protein FlgI [Acuticoccus sp. MNP-M23]
MRGRWLAYLVAAATCLLGSVTAIAQSEPTARIKDITTVQGVRDNQLIGYGLVIGLAGTGDTLRNAPFTEQALKSMLDRMGVAVRGVPLRARNVAAVTVTADLPPFVGVGSRIDVLIGSIGDASSLRGGTLVVTPLTGGDGKVYAVAQGPIQVSGLSVEGDAAALTQGVPTGGRIPNGALVERRVPGSMQGLEQVVLELNNPDYRTAALIADAVNEYTQRRWGKRLAAERNLRSVEITRPGAVGATRFLAEIGQIPVTPDIAARVVVDQRTGTVVIGQNVRVSTVALAHGNITLRVTEQPEVVQPDPFSYGETAIVPLTAVGADETGGKLAIVQGTDLQTLVHGLNRIGLTPTDIISILQTIKTAGALQAELLVQ